MVRDVISRLRAGALRVAPVLDPSKSALPAHSTSGSSSRSLSLSWPRLLLFCIVLYVCALVAYLVNTSPSTPFPKLHEVSSKAVTIAQAEEHARSVKMLPQGQKHDRGLRCIGWRATDNCSPYGPRLPKLDKPCHMLVKHEQSGYCEVEDIITKERFRVMKRYCRSLRPDSQFRCEEAQDFVNFPIQANKVIASPSPSTFARPIDEGKKKSKGIVMVVYPSIIPSAYASIRALREVLKCDLPLELWYQEKEMNAVPGSMAPMRRLSLASKGISFRRIDDGKVTGFSAKVFAIYHSYFDNVLFLDSDNVPVKDPSFLFETKEFKDTGAVFWPDFWHPRHTIFNVHGQSLLWELLDQKFVDMFEQESGQLVIDRLRHAASLELVKFYTFHVPNFFQTLQLVYGDKDLFRLAWLKLKSPFYMIDIPPAIAGKAFNNSFCGMTMVQHDANGEIIFLHRNSRKLVGKVKHLAIESKTSADTPETIPTQPGGQTKLTPQKSADLTFTPTLDAPEADGYPDAIYWTHVLSFRNTSKRVHYKVSVHSSLDVFTKGQVCYGEANMVNTNNHFFFQSFADFSFRGLENYLRRCAMEAAQIIHAEPHVRF